LYKEAVCQGSTCRGCHSLYGVFAQQHLWSQEMAFAFYPVVIFGSWWGCDVASSEGFLCERKEPGAMEICMACVARTSWASYQGYHTIPWLLYSTMLHVGRDWEQG